MAVFYNLKVGHLHNQKILDKWQNAYHYGIVLKKTVQRRGTYLSLLLLRCENRKLCFGYGSREGVGELEKRNFIEILGTNLIGMC